MFVTVTLVLAGVSGLEKHTSRLVSDNYMVTS